MLEINTVVATKIKDCIGCGKKFVIVETRFEQERPLNYCSELCKVRNNYGKIL